MSCEGTSVELPLHNIKLIKSRWIKKKKRNNPETINYARRMFYGWRARTPSIMSEKRASSRYLLERFIGGKVCVCFCALGCVGACGVPVCACGVPVCVCVHERVRIVNLASERGAAPSVSLTDPSRVPVSPSPQRPICTWEHKRNPLQRHNAAVCRNQFVCEPDKHRPVDSAYR